MECGQLGGNELRGLPYGAPGGCNKELHINCSDYTEAEILAMPFWERLIQELDKLDRQAHEILQKEFPDDEDIPGLAPDRHYDRQVRLLRDIFPLL